MYKRGSPRHLREEVMPRQALHAFSLTFLEPIKKYPMTFQTFPPDDLKKQIREAGICLHQLLTIKDFFPENVTAFYTTRTGGFSKHPYSYFNLADNVGDNPEFCET